MDMTMLLAFGVFFLAGMVIAGGILIRGSIASVAEQLNELVLNMPTSPDEDEDEKITVQGARSFAFDGETLEDVTDIIILTQTEPSDREDYVRHFSLDDWQEYQGALKSGYILRDLFYDEDGDRVVATAVFLRPKSEKEPEEEEIELTITPIEEADDQEDKLGSTLYESEYPPE